jgi:hypothetical protein
MAEQKLPAGWVKKYDDNKKKDYYQNKELKKTTWVFPVDENAPQVVTPEVVTPKVVTSKVVTPAVASGDPVLPAGWVKKYDDKKKKDYYQNKELKKTTWVFPVDENAPQVVTPEVVKPAVESGDPVLPAGWVKKYDDKKKKDYYQNKELKKTTWVFPVDENAPQVNTPEVVTPEVATASKSVPTTHLSKSKPSNVTMQDSKFLSWFKIDDKWQRICVELSGVLKDCSLNLFKSVENIEVLIDGSSKVTYIIESYMQIALSSIVSIICNELIGELKLLYKSDNLSDVNTLKEYIFKLSSLDETSWLLSEFKIRINTDNDTSLESSKDSVMILDKSSLLLSFSEDSKKNNAMFSLNSLPSELLQLERKWLINHATTLLHVIEKESNRQHALFEKELIETMSNISNIKFPRLLSNTHSNSSFNSEINSELPLIGQVIVQINKDNDNKTRKFSTGIKIENKLKTILLYSRGPGSIPSIIVDTSNAVLNLSSIVESNEYYFEVSNCKTIDKDDIINLTFSFQDSLHFWRWAVSIGSICSSSKSSVVNQSTFTETDTENIQGIAEFNDETSNGLIDNIWKNNLISLASSSLLLIAERSLPRTSIRSLIIPGELFKSMKFKIINQRVVLISKGKSELNEGSVLISINGFSTRTSLTESQGHSTMKMINELPLRLPVVIVMWQSPKSQFSVNMFGISPNLLATKTASTKTQDDEVVYMNNPLLLSPAKDEHSSEWQPSSLNIFDGILICKTKDDSQDILLYEIKLANCQWRFVHTNHSSDDCALDLGLELRDSTSHIIITHKNLQQLLRIASLSVQSMIILGSLSTSLEDLYNFSERWRHEENETVFSNFDINNNIFFGDKHNPFEADNASDLSTDVLEFDNIQQNDGDSTDLILAAKELESTLSSLDLPSVFPSPNSIQNIISDIQETNNINHLILSDILKFESPMIWSDEIKYEEVTDVVDKSTYIPKVEVIIEDEKNESKDESKDKENFEDLEAENLAKKEALAKSSGVRRRASVASMWIEKAQKEISSSNQINTPVIPSLTIPAFKSSVLSTPTVKAVSSTSTKLLKKSNLLKLNSKQIGVSSAFIMHIRDDPEFMLIMTKNLNLDDLISLSKIIVNRLCSNWSADQCSLGLFVEIFAKEDKKVQNGYKSQVANFFNAPPNEYENDEYFSFLNLLLDEISQREEVTSFLRYVCNDINVDIINSESRTGDICSLLVEPFCKKLESATISGMMPRILRYTARALTRSECDISPSDLLAKLFVPQIAQIIFQKHLNSAEPSRNGETDHIKVIDRIQDLFQLCFGRDLGKNVNLCLSDTAALSRSKWLISRYNIYIIYFKSF